MRVGDTSASAKEFDDHAWKKIGLPHAFNEDDAFKKSIYDLSTGIVWYRKHFKIDKSQQGKKSGWNLKGFAWRVNFISMENPSASMKMG